jgi:hypothetical protein
MMTSRVSQSLSETVVKNRHRTNAISLSGQFITGYILFITKFNSSSPNFNVASPNIAI